MDWYHRRAAAMTGSARNRLLALFDFGTRRRGYYPHSGLVRVGVRADGGPMSEEEGQMSCVRP